MSVYTLEAGRVVAIDGTEAFAITRVPTTAASMSPVELDAMAQRIVRLLNDDGPVYETGRSKCDNCSEVYLDADLNPVTDYGQRVTPGGLAPSGECPDEECGALCFPTREAVDE